MNKSQNGLPCWICHLTVRVSTAPLRMTVVYY